MLIPHLLFAHMLADYVLQSNWLVARKSKGLTALALHGFLVFLMSLAVLPRYLNVVFVPLLIQALLHTIQDWGKVTFGPRLKVAPFYPYLADQVLHYIVILIMQALVGPLLIPPPSSAEVLFMSVGTIAITVTRFYEVTWWSNWLDMIPYMNRWRWWGYAERLAIVALAAAGFFYIAPICAIPRIVYAWKNRYPLWRQRRGVAELVIGIILSIVLGLVLRTLVTGYVSG